MRKFVLISIVTVAGLLGFPASALAADGLRIPPGFTVAERETIAGGLMRYRLVREHPETVVNVAWQAVGSPSRLRVVLSNEEIAGAQPQSELTSSMCRRIRCLVAINGDFFAGEGTPVGAVLSEGQLLHSPNRKHHQLSLSEGGLLETGSLEWRGTLVPTDLRPLELDGVNIVREANQLVLYTPANGPTTGANAYGVELVVSVVKPAGPIHVGQTTVVELTELRRAGDSPIPGDGAVLSGHGRGAQALIDLWERFQSDEVGGEVLLRLDVEPDAIESIGGSPILVRNGRRWFADEDRELYKLHHPRTMAGWNAAGDLMLVTVDGRQPGYSVGLTMVEAAQLMIDLGAEEAINLDGGGSTTFVVDGAVVNRPSDRVVRRTGAGSTIVAIPRTTDRVVANVERPVAVALALVGPANALAEPVLLKPGTLSIPLADPTAAGRPALVLSSDVTRQDTGPIVLALMTLSAGAVAVRRRGFAA